MFQLSIILWNLSVSETNPCCHCLLTSSISLLAVLIKFFLTSGVFKSSILIEIPALVAYWKPNNFKESKRLEEEIKPNFKNSIKN